MSLPRLHDRAYSSSDDIHFIGGKSVTSGKITRSAGRPNVPTNVRKVVINSIKASRRLRGPTVDTGLRDKCENLSSAKVAGIYALVSLPQKNRAALIGFVVAPLSLANLNLLLRSEIGPSIGSVIAPLLALAMAVSALVCYAQWTAFVRAKKFNGSGLWGFATMTGSHVGNVLRPHKVCNKKPLPWKQYPKGR